jgi:hypothetical protein
VHVWANQIGHSTATWEANGASAVTLTGCDSASISPDTVNQQAGLPVNFTASSTGCPDPTYEFWVGYPNGSWVLKRGWGGPDFSWSTAGLAPGSYSVHVWANQQGASLATWEANGATISITITSGKCTSVSATHSDPTANPVTLTAVASGCPNPQYEFWIQYPNGTWYLKRGWGGATFDWSTTGLSPGTYNIHVWANNIGDSTATWEAYGSDSLTLS